MPFSHPQHAPTIRGSASAPASARRPVSFVRTRATHSSRSRAGQTVGGAHARAQLLRPLRSAQPLLRRRAWGLGCSKHADAQQNTLRWALATGASTRVAREHACVSTRAPSHVARMCDPSPACTTQVVTSSCVRQPHGAVGLQAGRAGQCRHGACRRHHRRRAAQAPGRAAAACGRRQGAARGLRVHRGAVVWCECV